MKSTVTQLAPRGSAAIFDGPCLALHSVVDLPVRSDGGALLAAALEESGLSLHARMIMLGYRNLSSVTDALFDFMSTDWPISSQATSQSAAVAAVVEAINAVQTGLAQQDTGRDFVVCNFLRGIGSIARHVSGLQAWGCDGDEVVDLWKPEHGRVAAWANSGRFTQVHFYKRELVTKAETEGVRLKILCQVATARDIGLLQKYR